MADKFDIHFALLPLEQQVSARVFGFVFASAVGVRGPQKLINRWLKCFMTPQGSDPFSKTYGTGFARLIGSSIQNITDLTDLLTLFVQDCSKQIRAFETTSFTPDDERLSSATIRQIVERGADGFDIYIGITNIAGQQITVLLPSTSPP